MKADAKCGTPAADTAIARMRKLVVGEGRQLRKLNVEALTSELRAELVREFHNLEGKP